MKHITTPSTPPASLACLWAGLISLVLLTGCTAAQTPVDTNTGITEALNQNENTEVVVINTNEAENTNEVVNENSNANSDVESDEIDTSDWLTYTNEEYGFSFKYPEEWEVDIIDENDEGGIGLSLGSINIVSNECRIQGDKVKTGTIDQLEQILVNDSAKKYEEISVNEVHGIQYYDVVNENGYKGYVHLYNINDNELNFRLVDNPVDKECQQIFNQMMLTIKLDS